MENFKSFGKKETVPFFPGFTAITGPNGSGKSNITDAILFVLGPKSSKVIRAGKLTDLIFNGGKKRKKPAKYCEVSLVFDNSNRKMPVESDEVVLKRRVKRAPLKGDPDNYYSYFYINDHSASLSDFTNLLNHARISADGYNLVRQGDVTNLVEMGSVERRKIIDDIAGVSAFDKDIEKTEEERLEAEENIQRISIVLEEIEKQIKQLKKDRDEAARYKELQDDLYESKAKLAFKKKCDVDAQIAEVQNQIESYKKEKENIEQKKKDLKKEYEEAQQRLSELEEKITDVGGDEAQGLKEKIDDVRMNLVKTKEKINYVKDEATDLNKDAKKISASLDEVNKKLSERKEEKDELQETLSSKQEALQEKEDEFSSLKDRIAQSDDASMDLSRELAKMREEHQEKQNELHELSLESDRVDKKLEILDSQIAELEETKSTYEFELKDVDWQLSEIKKEKKSLYRDKEKLEKKLFDKKKKESELANQLRDLENKIRGLQREYSQAKAENEAAESVMKGYTRAVRAVLSARDKGEIRGVHGTIAELADVDEQYESAMHAAAGSRLQSIVVDDDSVAAEAISFLRQKNLGRATFLPLNKMTARKPRGKALMAVRDDKSHGFAIDLIDFDDQYKNAFSYVFGDTVVVEDLATARKLMGGVRLVDLTGDIIESSGAMKGGSDPRSRVSFYGSQREGYEDIAKKLEAATNRQDSLSDELTSLRKEIEEIEQDLKEHKGEIDEKANVSDLEARKKEFSSRLKVLNEELEEKTKEKEDLVSQQEELQERVESCKARVEELNELKEEKTQQLFKGSKKEMAQQARALEEEILSLKKSIADMTSQLETLRNQVDLQEERKQELEDRLQQVKKEKKQHEEQADELQADAAEYREKLEALMNVESKLSGKIEKYTQERDEVYRKTVSLENELDKLGTRIESYVDLIARAEYRLPTLEDTAAELKEEYARFDVEVDDAESLPSVDSLQESIRVVEENMQELEPVNMRALDEYNHQSERKKKLDEDVSRLKKQKKNLMKLVREISKKKKHAFYEVFEEVNVNFQEVYSKLSEGGEAELILENPDDPFDGGLTIKARPRGKKILRLSALSGGEKSMASLALIFAIQQYDPSPFYVLDEVDMFLDGVNAEAVSRMIKQNSQYAQFIMVSLRKVALQGADHVYGVTMRDDGITEMVGQVDVSSIGPKGEIAVATTG